MMPKMLGYCLNCTDYYITKHDETACPHCGRRLGRHRELVPPDHPIPKGRRKNRGAVERTEIEYHGGQFEDGEW